MIAKTLSGDSIQLFTETMGALLSAGLPLQDAVNVCEKMGRGRAYREFCSCLLGKINEGKSLSVALLELNPGMDDFYISLVKIGESSGSISQVFVRLSDYIRRKKNVREKVAQAIFYPAIVAITSIGVVAIMMVYVFPKMEEIFEAFSDGDVSLTGKVGSLRSSLVVFMAIMAMVVMLFVVCLILRKTSKNARIWIDRMLISLPGIGGMICDSCTNDFCFAMKLLITSGLPVAQSLDYAKDSSGNHYYRKCICNVQKRIMNGDTFSSAVALEKVFPSYFVTWISLSEKTGNISDVFIQLSNYYMAENDKSITKIVSGIEPVLILVTGIFICVLLAQFVLPVFNMLGKL